MMLLEITSLPLDGLVHVSWHDTVYALRDQSLEIGTILGQKIEDPQVLEKMQASWRKFIETGQVWALIIGFIIGYIFRSFTGF
ncbi:MAG: hypothetical protein AB4041_19540 [Microcystaceae cyanobacterium]